MDATGGTHTLVAADQGKPIKVRVSFTDDAGNEESLTSEETAVTRAANTPATGVPTISGIVQVGQIQTASVSGIADADGLTNVSYSYLWLTDDAPVWWADYSGAMGPTYPLLWSDYGSVMKVRVTFTDDAGNEESLTSAGTAPVAHNPTTGRPTIIGNAQVGETLTADTSGLSDPDGLENAVYHFQWRANGDTDISGATNSSYTIGADQLGKTIDFFVGVTDDRIKQVLTSAATAAVAAANIPATGAPTISGTVHMGQTLTAETSGITDANGLDNASFSYQWIRVDTDSTETDISGATGGTHTLVAADQGKTIKVRVSFTDDAEQQPKR